MTSATATSATAGPRPTPEAKDEHTSGGKERRPDETPARILVVEDESDIAALVAYQLTREGYRVETVMNGSAGLEALHRELPDLLVLDRMLPGVSGDDLLKAIRSDPATRSVPVLILTAKREQEDKISGFELGADDYLTKPFSPRELVLRADAILRRVRSGGQSAVSGGRILQAGPLQVDLGALTATVDGEEIVLTPTEFRLLRALMERQGRTLKRRELLVHAWEVGHKVANRIHTRTVDMYIRRLRAKLGPVGDQIETVRGFGYRFKAQAGAKKA